MNIDDIANDIQQNRPTPTESAISDFGPAQPEPQPAPVEAKKPEKTIFKDADGKEHPDFNPELHRTKNGTPVMRKNGTYALKTGRPTIKKPNKQTGAAPQSATTGPTPAPSFTDPAEPLPPSPMDEARVFAKEIVQMEQYAAFIMFQEDGKFTNDGTQALEMCWQRYAIENGAVKIPLWVEMLTAHGVAFNALLTRPKPKNSIERAKLWVQSVIINRRRGKAEPKKEEKEKKAGWFSKKDEEKSKEAKN
jgi:hypothetical protein